MLQYHKIVHVNGCRYLKECFCEMCKDTQWTATLDNHLLKTFYLIFICPL